MPRVERLCVSMCGNILQGRQLKYCSVVCSKRKARDAQLRRDFDITIEEYDEILAFQGGVCPICLRAPRVGETFVVDHEHRKGAEGPVRGVICMFDNLRTIGRLKDADKAQRVADYMRNPPATQALGRVVIAPGRPKKKRVRRTRRKKP